MVVYLGYGIVAGAGGTAIDHRGSSDHIDATGFVEMAAYDQGRLGLFYKLAQGGAAYVLEKMGAIEFKAVRRHVGKHDVPAGVLDLAVAYLKALGHLFFGKGVHSLMPGRRG